MTSKVIKNQHLSKYKPEFCKQILEFGKQGLARAEVASQFGISRRLLYDWINDTNKPEFMAAYEQYETELESYCQRMLRLIAEGQVKGKQNIAAHIYRIRTLLGQKCPEYLIDLKKEIKHETHATPGQVKEELKKILANNFNLIKLLTEDVTNTEPRSIS